MSVRLVFTKTQQGSKEAAMAIDVSQIGQVKVAPVSQE
jgi:hypothetical protein